MLGYSALVVLGLIAWGVLSVLLAMSFRQIVPTNEVHTVQTRKKTTSYGKDQAAGNCYYVWPAWFPRIGCKVIKLPVSVFDLKLDEYAAYDKGRVPFVVDILAFFRIDNPNQAAQRVSSFQELKQQLYGIVQGATRSILATAPIEEILEKRAEYGRAFTEATNDQLKAWGIENVKNIELMDIRDASNSKVIQNIMAMKQSSIEKESRIAVANNQQAASVAEINAKQTVLVRQQEAEEQVGIRTATRTQQIGIADQKAQQAIKLEEKETATKSMDVQNVNQVRSAEIARSVEITKADQQRQVQVKLAEGEQGRLVAVATGTRDAALLEAEAVRAKGVAEGDAKTAINNAAVAPQITLAKEIGQNEKYQQYLVTIRQVERDQAVGIEQAHALAAAEIKVIANAGNAQDGVKSAMELLTTKGGTQLGGFLEALNQTPEGAKVLEAVANTAKKVTGNGVTVR